MIEVRMDRVIRIANLPLCFLALLLGVLDLVHGESLTGETLMAFGRISLVYWVLPVAIAYCLLNFYEMWDLSVGWEQDEAAAERLIRLVAGVLVIAIALTALYFI